MGVIHKLREDVVSFILATKKENPSIGVRTLAGLTSEHFQTPISKSSVNNLLKHSGMSSSIGRRPGKRDRSEKFFIPEEKKRQISKNMEKAGFVKDEKTAVKKETPPLRAVEPLEQKESVCLEPSPPAPLKKEEVAPAEKKVLEGQNQKPRPKEKGIPLSGGSGFIFLKAAEWDISRQSLLAEVFKKYIQVSVSKRFDSVSDMFLFFKFLGIESVEHVKDYRRHGLWAFNHFCGKALHGEKDLEELQNLFDWMKTIESSSLMESVSGELRKIKEQAFFEVKGFKLLLEDKSEISMDASMVSFAGGGTIPFLPCWSFPMQKAIDRLSNCLISNVSNAVFQKVPGESAFDRVFYDLFAFFENIPGKRILRASVIDEYDQEIAGFSTVPFQKRVFLIGLGPEQEEFHQLVKEQKEIPGEKAFYHKETGRTLYYSESGTEFLNSFMPQMATKARVIALWEKGKNAPFWAILTNDAQRKAGNILEEYVSQWPYFGEMLEEDSILAFDPLTERDIDSSSNLQGDGNVFSEFVGDLHQYCQKHFFSRALSKIDLKCLFTDIYSSPGSFLESETMLTVVLEVPESVIDRKDLQYAVQKVNERHILDHLGRRLWLQA